jgi:hypothetical protein
MKTLWIIAQYVGGFVAALFIAGFFYGLLLDIGW